MQKNSREKTSNTETAVSLLTQPTIHEKWTADYRTRENEPFFDQAFSHLVRITNAQRNCVFLDVGCGSCSHAIRLATQGFQVRAVDLSEIVLRVARERVKELELEDRVKITGGDLTQLPFKTNSFDSAVCWGVLMHIPEVEQGVSEIVRVLRPGGKLIVSEANMHSLQACTVRVLKQVLGKKHGQILLTQAGVEYWDVGAEGTLLTREANIPWLTRQFITQGCIVRERIAGQFTEAYTRVRSERLRRLIHRFNQLWFNHIRIPHLAFGNILVLEKVQ